MKNKNLGPKHFETQLEFEMFMILKAAADEFKSVTVVDALEGDWMEKAVDKVDAIEKSKLR